MNWIKDTSCEQNILSINKRPRGLVRGFTEERDGLSPVAPRPRENGKGERKKREGREGGPGCSPLRNAPEQDEIMH